ncbi:MAG: 4Fe-4S binding protein [Lachnospiraceae bacterium]|nr:4Fe-4S binding protein [Lachnospiraceae bacterium]
MIKPSLEKKVKITALSQLPQGGSCRAGVLVEKNAGWRNKCPVFDSDKCIGCHLCYLYCPDGVISRKGKKIKIDYDFCKGCGICERICRVGAIHMEDEK